MRCRYFYIIICISSIWISNIIGELCASTINNETKIREEVAANPNDPSLHVELGNFLIEQKKVNEAIDEYTKALEIKPDYSRALARRAQAYMSLGEIEKAISDFKEVIRINPKEKGAYVNLSIIYRDRKEYDRAIGYCQKALEIKEDGDIYYDLAIIYMDMGNKEKAREYFTKVISVEGRDSVPSELALKKLEELRALESKPTGPALDYKGYIPSEEEAIEVALAWLAIVDNEQYVESWETSADYLKNVIPKEDWVQSLKGVRSRMGKVTSRELKTKEYTRTLVGAPDGDYVVIQYETSFENKQSAVETLTPMLDKDGKWRVSGYYIR